MEYGSWTKVRDTANNSLGKLLGPTPTKSPNFTFSILQSVSDDSNYSHPAVAFTNVTFEGQNKLKGFIYFSEQVYPSAHAGTTRVLAELELQWWRKSVESYQRH